MESQFDLALAETSLQKCETLFLEFTSHFVLLFTHIAFSKNATMVYHWILLFINIAKENADEDSEVLQLGPEVEVEIPQIHSRFLTVRLIYLWRSGSVMTGPMTLQSAHHQLVLD